MSRGFTLIEVVVALLLLEVGVLAAAGTLQVASRTLAEAERVQRAVVAAGGILDSLARVAAPSDGNRTLPFGEVAWSVDDTGAVILRAETRDGVLLLDVTSAVAAR
ncbi:MAG: prepilin-type N-terminal cleavage/methylation domain-containing protein [Gemmatimonadota bacterium]|jgi:prepilin-type N-terminal cleavage/methylation domain-containing protein